MWWGIGIGGALLYFIVAVTLGLMTLRNGHGWMFFLGIFFPVLWIFGAFMRPTIDERSIAADSGDYSTPTGARDEATRVRTGL
jgi:ABC-type multidrug transport system permease subunit